jgi:hypothetical protein
VRHYNYFRDYDPGIGRYVESDQIGLVGGLNTYAYVRSRSLGAIDPLGLDTVIITIYDHGIGTHSAVRIDNGKDPILYDPAGSYCRPKKKDSNQCEPRGENDTFYGNDANLNNYIKFHTSLGSGVRTLRFSTRASDEAQIARRIDGLGGTLPFYCARSVSDALSGTGPFRDLSSYFSPGNLHDELQRRGGK